MTSLITRSCRFRLRWVGGLLLCWFGAGCSSLDYYTQLAQGHAQLLLAREPIDAVLIDRERDPQLRQQLALATAARQFASQQLALPDNQSYRLYADIQRPYVVWNVFVTGEFSLQADTHCFPIAGCVAYRGFYQQGRARGAAALARLDGKDVWVAGVEAYSTLGWFDDPVLSSMLRRDDQQLAALLFHELAHQQLYVDDDTAFNESFASFVEVEGLRQWLRSRNQPPVNAAQHCQRQQFIALVLESRRRLQQLYSGTLPASAMREQKRAEFERLRAHYWQLRAGPWQGMAGYDPWFAGPLNNAKLLPFGLYEQWQPAFAELFRQAGGEWSRFYAHAQTLAEQPAGLRQSALQRLVEQSNKTSITPLNTDCAVAL